MIKISAPSVLVGGNCRQTSNKHKRVSADFQKTLNHIRGYPFMDHLIISQYPTKIEAGEC